MKEIIERLTLVKKSELEGEEFYVFSNSESELRVTGVSRFSGIDAFTGSVYDGKLKRVGCSGYEIIELCQSEEFMDEGQRLK